MLRIDKTFKDRLIKWTAVLAVILEIIMVIINFPDIKEILTYCGMGAVIIFFVIITEIQGLAFCLRYGLIRYVDEAKQEAQESIASAEDILSKRMEELEKSVNNEEDKNDS